MNQTKKIGELKILLKSLKRGTTKPLINNIEIIYPSKQKTNKKYIGIIDTGSDITSVDSNLLKILGLKELELDIFELEIKIPELFGERILVFETQSYNITHNNKSDIKPDILLGRDFLSQCKLFYDGINNSVLIESFDVD